MGKTMESSQLFSTIDKMNYFVQPEYFGWYYNIKIVH